MLSIPRNKRKAWVATTGFVLIQLLGFAQNANRQGPSLSPTHFEFDPQNPDYQVVERGPHHDLLQRIVHVVDETGQPVERIAQYSKLGGGLNHFDSDQQKWVPAQALIEAFEGGAVAQHGQTKVIFSPTLGDPDGTVDILTADGQRFRSVVLGLAYYDPVTGDDVILSEVNPDVVGQIIPPNQVIYPNAFTDINADLVYEYRRSGFSQNVVLREQPPDPSRIGFSAATRLEVLSEFLEAPIPVKNARVVERTAVSKTQSVDVLDEALSFGPVKIGAGRAFNLQAPEGTAIPVSKRWSNIDGRAVLFEGISFERARPDMERLPVSDDGNSRASLSPNHHPDRTRHLPKRQFAGVVPKDRSGMQLATLDPLARVGYLIDYELVTGSVTDQVFKKGSTYLIDGRVYCYGTTTIEGGTVVKYPPYAAGSEDYLDIRGPTDCQTSPYHPAIFTARDDDTVGEAISQGALSGYYAYEAIRLDALTSGNLLSNLKIQHAILGISPINGSGAKIRNIQFENCHTAIGVDGTDLEIENVLILNSGSRAIWGRNATIDGVNLTIHDSPDLFLDLIPSSSTISLTNSLLTEITTIQSYTGQGASHNVELSSASGVYQTAGGGNYYLASSSPYRDLGTSGIDPDLVNELATRTTHPPTIYDAPPSLTSNTTFSPHVQRDNNGTPDLGYHYPAIDYLIYNMWLADGVALTVQPGTHIAWYGKWGITVNENSKLHLNGTPIAPVRLGWYGDLQDSVDPARIDSYVHNYVSAKDLTSPNLNEIRMNYVHAYGDTLPTSYNTLISLGAIGDQGAHLIDVRNCDFQGLRFYVIDTTGRNHTWQNNNFERAEMTFRGYPTIHFQNNRVSDSELLISQHAGSDYWTFSDNIFEGLQLISPTILSSGNVDYNAYLSPSEFLGTTLRSNDHNLTSLTYQSGPFGNYYQPTGSVLIDAGSRLADAAGLLHHTVLANGQPEGTSTTVTTVDIGLHYPAVNNDSGVLLDSDWDGFPNILEDPNGNGTTETGESLWKAADSPHVTGPGSVVIFNLTGSTL